jgi:hypothetical protein
LAGTHLSAAFGADSAHLSISSLLHELERVSGRYAAAEAALRDPASGCSEWLRNQAVQSRDLADLCTDAEILAMIARGRLMNLAEQHSVTPVSPRALAEFDASPWRLQAQRCMAELPADLAVREAAAVLVWAVGRALGGRT